MDAIYLAARYSRRLELCNYRRDLNARGITVTSRWLDGSHQLDNAGTPIGDDGENLVDEIDGVPNTGDRAAELRQKFATDDRDDVLLADLLIAFTEQPRTSNSRGGRHVELGIALGAGIPVVIVGPRENVFCWLPEVRHFDTWPECLAALAEGGEPS